MVRFNIPAMVARRYHLPPFTTTITESQIPIVSLSPPRSLEMDLSDIAKKLGLKESKQVVRKAAELRRVSDLQFDSSNAGIGETCKALICLEIAANIYRDRFMSSLPAWRRATTDCSKPVFTAAGFYLCAKKHKLKVDKTKLIELSGSSEDEFSSVCTSMKDLCHDVFGVAQEKKDPKSVKGNRDLLDVLPEKRQTEDGGYSSDEGEDHSAYKKRKREDNHKYEEWKSTVVESNKQNKEKVGVKRTKQAQLNFLKRDQGTEVGAT
uniref:ORC6 second cyclin-like domain-containing protein n=1 Tax=Lactuca sativa TaxID=4236 RepID=A0A9R1WX56_LACSA|nr:hypothetical protein LSAT_V11C800410780 [Lactuca sativa]